MKGYIGGQGAKNTDAGICHGGSSGSLKSRAEPAAVVVFIRITASQLALVDAQTDSVCGQAIING